MSASNLWDTLPQQKSRSWPGTTIPLVARCVALILLSLLVVSCGQEADEVATESPTPSRTPVLLGPTYTPTASRATPTRGTPTSTLVPLAPISAEDWSRGSPHAPVTLVVYSDFQCPGSAQLAPILKQLNLWHPEDLRIIYRHLPILTLHDKASLAGQAAEAAGVQGAFWIMHDALFDHYLEWVDLSQEAFLEWVIQTAGDLGLETDQFIVDLESDRFAEAMDNAFEETAAAGIPGTPFVYLNGMWYRLPLSLLNLEASIRLELLKSRQYTNYPPMTIDIDSTYIATLHLESGDVIIQLYPKSAPIAVNSFIFLAREGWFDDNIFQSVQSGVLVESGDPSGTGLGGPGYHFDIEVDPALSFDQPGMVALSNSGPGTNGSQFFITLMPLPELNTTRSIFGRVIEGLDLLQTLGDRHPYDDLLEPPEAAIRDVTIEVR